MRHDRNGIMSQEEQEKLFQRKVCVVGCGGLGGYVLEMLVRLGVGTVSIVDGDVFQLSNLNRQLLSLTDNMGTSKVFSAYERCLAIDPDIQVNPIAVYIDEDNIMDIIAGHDMVIDALDSNEARAIVLKACKESEIPCIYGAIAGWYGQVSTVFPEDVLVRQYIIQSRNKGVETFMGNPSFSPACVASYQVAEAIKVLINKGSLLREKIMFLDLLNNEVEFME